MDEKIFKDRTKKLALRVMRLVEDLPHTRSADVIAKQTLRSATSIGANYRAACRAKSVADMIVKFKIVEEESDETMYWLELLLESNKLPHEEVSSLMKETNEIVAMTVASIKTLRARNAKS
ncbi:MAG TPA: four helix bundle protein [Anaerolineales bacterium]|jgi:four helix bundle protein|nr:four helix bundle protein [Anaerolineales bacterium]